MRILTVLAASLLLTACNSSRLNVKAGVAFDFNEFMGAESGTYIENRESSVQNLLEMQEESPNPLGTVIVEYKQTERLFWFIQHVTSIPNQQDGAGLNFGGALYQFK